MTSRKSRRARDMIGRATVSAMQMQRERLFGALGIIAVTRQACESMEDRISVMDALEVVYDVVNDVAGALERFAADSKREASQETTEPAE
jgi:hypothetical protein